MVNAILTSTAAILLFWIAAPFALSKKAVGEPGLEYVWLAIAFGSIVVFTVSTLKLFLMVLGLVVSIALTVLSVAIALGVVVWLYRWLRRKSAK